MAEVFQRQDTLYHQLLGIPAYCWIFTLWQGCTRLGHCQALTMVLLCFLFRIHSKEHFKEKYAVDDVQYVDEVRSSRDTDP